MKKLLPITSVFATLLLVPQAYADGICPTGSGFSGLCSTGAGANTFSNLISGAINLVFVLSAVVALFFLVWGGFKWMISQGEKAGVEAARAHIINALIGLIVIFLSYVILNLVLGIFGIKFSDIKLPTLNLGAGA